MHPSGRRGGGPTSSVPESKHKAATASSPTVKWSPAATAIFNGVGLTPLDVRARFVLSEHLDRLQGHFVLPAPRTNTSVFAVPRSIARSFGNLLKNIAPPR